jgi:phosphotransferase system HPr (HPr) family protein
MQTTATRTVVVRNREGLHLRAAMSIAQKVKPFESTVELVKADQRAKAMDIFEVLALGAEPGTELVLEANGPDAEPALEALVRLFFENFGEE